MKRLVITGFVSVFLLMTFIVIGKAQSCDDSQRILRISAPTNAHAEIWNQGIYTVDVCYNTYFGDYTEPNPHQCSGSNRVLRLSSATNAHAEGPDVDSYAVEVCFGDLNCRLTLEACGEGEQLVLRLSSTTNAHVAFTEYSQNLCCTGGTPIPCGDGQITGSEQCDPTANPIFENYGSGIGQCTNYDPDVFESGDLNCYQPGHTQECQIDTSECSGGENLCELATSGNAITIEGASVAIDENFLCTTLNDIQEGDIPRELEDQGVELNEYKETLCNQCLAAYPSVAMHTVPLEDQDVAIDPHCEWDGNSCEVAYTSVGGELCRVEQIGETECNENLRRIITYTSTCDANCAPPTGCTREVICPRVVQFPFFGTFHIVFSLLIIGLIYLFYAIRKRWI